MRALFGRKITNLEELKDLTEQAKADGARGSKYTVTKEKTLSDAEFQDFAKDFFQDHDWITSEDGGPDEQGGNRCIRVINAETGETVLVNNEGFTYARYTALEA